MSTVQEILREGGRVVVKIAPKETKVVSIVPKDQVVVTVNRGLPGAAATEVVDVYTLTTEQITGKKIELSAAPLVPANTDLVVKGALPIFYGDDFTVVGDELSWDGLGLDGLLEAGDKVRVRFLV